MLNVVPRKALGYGMGGSSAESSAGMGGNQVCLDEKLAARGTRALSDRGGCGQRRLTRGYFSSNHHTPVCLKNKTVKAGYAQGKSF